MRKIVFASSIATIFTFILTFFLYFFPQNGESESQSANSEGTQGIGVVSGDVNRSQTIGTVKGDVHIYSDQSQRTKESPSKTAPESVSTDSWKTSTQRRKTKKTEKEYTKSGFGFVSRGCKISGGKAVCTIAVKNLSDSEQELYIINYSGGSDSSSLFGANGIQKRASNMRFGDSSHRNMILQSIPSELTINATFIFDAPSRDIFPAALRISAKNGSNGDRFSITVKEVEVED